jgi:hypothetical protein
MLSNSQLNKLDGVTRLYVDTTIAGLTMSGGGATGPTGPAGPLLIRESDYVYPYHYSGSAEYGTSTSSNTWFIRRVDFTSSPVTLSATGSWTDRYSLIYS